MAPAAKPPTAASVAADARSSSAAVVSVIVPCFNQASFLGQAVRSALTQSGCRVEVVVVDDASTDATQEVATGFPEVTYVRRHRNGGLARARNAGLAVAKGEYVVFLDADDWLLPGALEAGLRCFAADVAAGFAVGSFLYVRSDGSELGERQPIDLASDAYLALLPRNVVAMIATVLFRRGAIDAVGGLDVRLRACEDYDLMLRIARKFCVLQHPTVVACYRMHAQNMSRDHALMLKSSLQALRKQRRSANGTAAWRDAYREGIEFWRAWYGKFLLKDVMDQLSSRRDPLLAARRAAVLLRHVGIRRLSRWWIRRDELAAHTELPY